MNDDQRPLDGISVLELGQNIAGPYAGVILAALGADVVKIERPEGGDDARGWGPPFRHGVATTFAAMNRDKRSVTVDFKDPEQVAWLRERARTVDVIVQNMRPGSLETLGLDATTLCAANERLVYCNVGAFGHKGPSKRKPGYEPILQAFAGMFAVNGPEAGPGVRVGMQVLDLGTGVWAALGCLAGLLRRHATGRGCVVDASLLETALGWLQCLLAGFNATGRQPARHSSGNPAVVVFQSFATADREILVAAANDRLFQKLMRVTGLPAFADDPRFATNALRVANKADVLPVLQATFATRPAADWLATLEAAGIPCAPINDFEAVVADPQVRALGILQAVPGLDLDLVGLPLSFDGERPSIDAGPPALGEHTAALRGTAGANASTGAAR